jgi:hypothetical protein
VWQALLLAVAGGGTADDGTAGTGFDSFSLTNSFFDSIRRSESSVDFGGYRFERRSENQEATHKEDDVSACLCDFSWRVSSDVSFIAKNKTR